MPEPQGLLRAAVVQHAKTLEVLMLGWMDDVALRLSQETGEAHFWSRSRSRLWRKGETSANVLRIVEVLEDCDGDALLVKALPSGPVCHTGTRTCFATSIS